MLVYVFNFEQNKSKDFGTGAIHFWFVSHSKSAVILLSWPALEGLLMNATAKESDEITETAGKHWMVNIQYYPCVYIRQKNFKVRH